MSKLQIPLIATLLFAWLLLGPWWYAKNYCGAINGAANNRIPTFYFADGNFQTSATHHFSFETNTANLHISDEVQNSIAEIAQYLPTATGKKELVLTGL